MGEKERRREKESWQLQGNTCVCWSSKPETMKWSLLVHLCQTFCMFLAHSQVKGTDPQRRKNWLICVVGAVYKDLMYNTV